MSEEIYHLKTKIKKLEEQVQSLRLGRRVLMNLIIDIEKAKNLEIALLKKEIKALKHSLKKCH